MKRKQVIIDENLSESGNRLRISESVDQVLSTVRVLMQLIIRILEYSRCITVESVAGNAAVQ